VAHHVSREKFEEYVRQAISGLPPQFRGHLEGCRLEVRKRPSKRELRELGMEEDELLLGLYVGQPLTERSVADSGHLPDVIYLFQEDCELVSDSAEQLVEEVRITVLHELGHHFGMDEEDLGRLGYG
jgi:predicted Zn-dependent protease with MMP-like domain